ALTRVVAFCSLTGRPMTEELAQDVLKDVFPQGELPRVTIEGIQETVSDRFGLSLAELCGDKRSQNIVYPRQVAMYLSRELTDSSLPKIGREFGGRDHTTVIHATSKIARLMKENPPAAVPRQAHGSQVRRSARMPLSRPSESQRRKMLSPPAGAKREVEDEVGVEGMRDTTERRQ